MRPQFKCLVIAAALVGVTSGASAANVTHTAPPGAIAPPFKLTDLKGHPITLSGLKGKIVLLDFWASWCAPCVVGIPALLELQSRLKDKGVVIVGVALDNADRANRDAETKLRDFVADHRIDYPVAEISERFNSDYGKVLGLAGGRIVGSNKLVAANLPSWIIIDRAGTIRSIHKASSEEHQVLAEVDALAR